MNIDHVNFQGGSSRHCIAEWRKITADKWILDRVQGVWPNFLIKPIQFSYPKRFVWSEAEHEIIDNELTILLRKGVIQKACASPDQFISNVFLRKKPNGTYRVILNLKHFNDFVAHTHFKMDTLKDAILLIKKGCFFTSIDLQDAFYTIPLSPLACKYFRFIHRDQLYEFTSLVMGYKDSPRIFTKLTKPFLATLREQNVQIMMYLDDALLVHDSVGECVKATEQTISLIERLGFQISKDKSSLTPQNRITYLGFVLNSIDMSVRPSDEKVTSLRAQLDAVLKQNNISLRVLAELIGKFNALTPGNRYGTVFCKRLEIQKTASLKQVSGDYDSLIFITAEMREDISWWRHNANKYPVLLSPHLPAITITTDASNTGWDGISDGVVTGGLWSKDEQSLHINCLELKAALLSIKAFISNKRNCFVHLLSDNTTTVMCINNQGSTKKACNIITRELWVWCIVRNNWITASHLPGVDNIEADKKSRCLGLETEWSLLAAEFCRVEARYGPFDTE